jgi:integrase
VIPLLESHKAKVRSSEIGILTPAEFARLLESASDETLPYWALGGFTGLRTAELERLDWQRSILIFDSDLVEVKATKQKPPHVGEVPLTREFETTITAIETKNDRSLES